MSDDHIVKGVGFVAGCVAIGLLLAFASGTFSNGELSDNVLDEPTAGGLNEPVQMEDSFVRSETIPTGQETVEAPEFLAFADQIEGEIDTIDSDALAAILEDNLIDPSPVAHEGVCDADGIDPDCVDELSFDVMFVGSRLISALASNEVYGGGSHGVVWVSDYQFDVETKRRVLFGDLFTSWPTARDLIQEQFCQELVGYGTYLDASIECPSIEETAMALFLHNDGAAPYVIVRTSDYQLGFFAAGRVTVPIELTGQLRSLVRPEYLETN